MRREGLAQLSMSETRRPFEVTRRSVVHGPALFQGKQAGSPWWSALLGREQGIPWAERAFVVGCARWAGSPLSTLDRARAHDGTITREAMKLIWG
jgi:hypothetical protein